MTVPCGTATPAWTPAAGGLSFSTPTRWTGGVMMPAPFAGIGTGVPVASGGGSVEVTGSGSFIAAERLWKPVLAGLEPAST